MRKTALQLSAVAVALILTACGPVRQETRTFNFDPNAKPLMITPPARRHLDLPSNTVYTFKITGVNSAYHTVNYNVTKEKKDITIPSVLAAVIPDGSATSTPITLDKILNYAGAQTPGTQDQKLDASYKILSDYYKNGKDAITYLNNHWTDINDCHTYATNTITQLCTALDPTAKTADDLAKAIRTAIIDFKSRFNLMKDNQNINDDDRGVSLYKADRFVDSTESFLLKIPVILQAYQNCLDYIVSSTYDQQKADYLNVGFTIYKNRFYTHDSIAAIKTSFYRINYVKFDVTAGAFLTNLVTPAFHFTDTLGHFAKETKATADLSIGALVHLQYVANSWFKPGICAGASVSVLDGKTKYLGGLSLLFGRRNEFCVSGGAALAILPAPSNAVTATGYTSTLEGTVPTYNKTTWGKFVGVSYSFIKN